MSRKIAGAAVLVTVFGLAGCGTQVGMSKHENRGKLTLSQLTRDQALLFFGPPLRDRTITNNHGAFDQFQYGTSDGSGTRVMMLEFRSDRLNAYAYLSTFPEDSTEFDMTLANKIVAGTHTKGDVLMIIGNPAGKAFCPSAMRDYEDRCDRGKEIWKWLARNEQSLPHKTKEVVVIFDGNDVVVDVMSKVESSREN